MCELETHVRAQHLRLIDICLFHNNEVIQLKKPRIRHSKSKLSKRNIKRRVVFLVCQIRRNPVLNKLPLLFENMKHKNGFKLRQGKQIVVLWFRNGRHFVVFSISATAR